MCLAGNAETKPGASHPAGGDCLPAQRGATLRAILLGLCVAAAVNLEICYTEYILHASRLTLSHFPMGTLIAFLFVVVGVNAFLRPRLSASELLVILAMGLVAGMIPSDGLSGYLMGVLASPYYFASPENQWATYLHPNIPSWIAPRNSGRAIDYLFEGLPAGAHIPWGVWVVPLLWWGELIVAFIVLSVCLSVILRRQWAEHERLVYPLLRPALEMVDESDASGRLPKFMQSRLFWCGFVLAFGILFWNINAYLFPGFPEIPNIRTAPWIYFARSFPGIWTRINLFTISFAYFANVDVLFSFLFFDALFILRSGILNRFGLNASNTTYATGAYIWIDIGAFFTFVLWGLWTARDHMRRVFLRAVRREGGSEDAGEMVPYRTAMIGLLLAIALIVSWFHKAGMEIGIAILYTGVTLLLQVGVARLVADIGLAFVSVPARASDILVSGLGSGSFSKACLTVFAFANALTSFGRGLFMPVMTHAARIGDSCLPRDRRRLLAGILMAFLVSILISVGYTLYLGYTRGAYNFHNAPFSAYSPSGFMAAQSQIRNPAPPDLQRLTLLAVGAATMSALMLLRYRLAWWPIHPIGFALASSATYVRNTVFSVFIAWAIKATILRFGGATLYRTYRPFFLGVLVGYAFGVALSTFVDAVWFPGAGHQIHTY